MYNIHKYNEQVRRHNQATHHTDRTNRFLSHRENFKHIALTNQSIRLDAFLKQQSLTPFTFQDDHYLQWRTHKLYRDVENVNKFIGFKTFRHKPNSQMGRIFNERERKEIELQGGRKQKLIQSHIIPEEQRNRSLMCQGPLNPKISFRMENKRHIQPRLRFTNITDQERMRETTLLEKVNSVYNSFSLTKSKIGKVQMTPIPQSRYPTSDFDAVDMCRSIDQGEMNEHMDVDERMNQHMDERMNQHMDERMNQHMDERMNNEMATRMTARMTARKRMGLSPKKTYFKLAKTMQLLKRHSNPEDIEELMKSTQYERRKDMKNIQNNSSCENYLKDPI